MHVKLILKKYYNTLISKIMPKNKSITDYNIFILNYKKFCNLSNNNMDIDLLFKQLILYPEKRKIIITFFYKLYDEYKNNFKYLPIHSKNYYRLYISKKWNDKFLRTYNNLNNPNLINNKQILSLFNNAYNTFNKILIQKY